MKFEARKPKSQKHLNFGFVSNFDIRISSLSRILQIALFVVDTCRRFLCDSLFGSTQCVVDNRSHRNMLRHSPLRANFVLQNSGLSCGILLAFFVACVGVCNSWADPELKQPNVAGTFYPDDPDALSKQISAYLRLAGRPSSYPPVPVAIVPHAGYVYSGPVAAYTYKALGSHKYSTVIVIAPSHFYPFKGAAIWSQGGFRTPLGILNVDKDFAKSLIRETQVVQDLPEVFAKEHALEVQLPFIQKSLGNVRIVPLLMGQPDFKVCEELAVALRKRIGERRDILVLISSDMSHYYTYDAANAMDARTLTAIQAGDIEKFWKANTRPDELTGKMEMCGFVPVTVGMMLAKLLGLPRAEVLNYANSGDTAGDKSRVVGYGSIIFYDPAFPGLTADQKTFLLSVARKSVEIFVSSGQKREVKTNDLRLSLVQGAFVTIHKNGQLRGCIGDIIGRGPLAHTVRDMAIAAASQDPRFPPIGKAELKDINIELSVLSAPRRIKNASDIVLGRDGVILSNGGDHQGIFLPQVAAQTQWSKEEFLAQLCSQKAGLDVDCWMSPDIVMHTFTAEVFSE